MPAEAGVRACQSQAGQPRRLRLAPVPKHAGRPGPKALEAEATAWTPCPRSCARPGEPKHEPSESSYSLIGTQSRSLPRNASACAALGHPSKRRRSHRKRASSPVGWPGEPMAWPNLPRTSRTHDSSVSTPGYSRYLIISLTHCLTPASTPLIASHPYSYYLRAAPKSPHQEALDERRFPRLKKRWPPDSAVLVAVFEA